MHLSLLQVQFLIAGIKNNSHGDSLFITSQGKWPDSNKLKSHNRDDINTESRDLLSSNYSILTTVYALQFTVGLVKMVLCKLFCKLQEYLIQVVLFSSMNSYCLDESFTVQACAHDIQVVFFRFMVVFVSMIFFPLSS